MKIVKDKVHKVDAKSQKVILVSKNEVRYDILIVASGLELQWQRIKGLQTWLNDFGDSDLVRSKIASIYSWKHLKSSAEIFHSFQRGKAIFIMPTPPIKCAGAPQKILYLFEDLVRKKKIRSDVKIEFYLTGAIIFSVPFFAEELVKIAAEKGIDVFYGHKLIEVNIEEKKCWFQLQAQNSLGQSVKPITEKIDQKIIDINFDLLHVVPEMDAAEFIRTSELAVENGPLKGWLEVDELTLQSKKYFNIFGIGDCTGIPNSKTAAAIRHQIDVVGENVISFLNSRSLEKKYSGYSSCPLITEEGKVLLAEFGYDGRVMPTFPIKSKKPRKFFWWVNQFVVPILYWNFMLKGWALLKKSGKSD